jgi:phosphoribosyl-AMP cyclohydrolase
MVEAVQQLEERIRWNDAGLVPAIVQDVETKAVLMMAWVSRESLRQTLATGDTVFWSRSRQAIWHKGETSGNTQQIVDFRIDCDGDTLLFVVEAAGPACHTGERSCFFRTASEFSETETPYV